MDLHSYSTVCFGKFQLTPATLLWSERHLGLHCHLADQDQDEEESAKEKKNVISFFNFRYQNCKLIHVTFDIINIWNQGVFLCSPCISTTKCLLEQQSRTTLYNNYKNKNFTMNWLSNSDLIFYLWKKDVSFNWPKIMTLFVNNFTSQISVPIYSMCLYFFTSNWQRNLLFKRL